MNVTINIIEDSKIRKASTKKAINKKSLTGCVNCGDFCTGPPLPGMCMGILKKKLSKFVCKPQENILGWNADLGLVRALQPQYKPR